MIKNVYLYPIYYFDPSYIESTPDCRLWKWGNSAYILEIHNFVVTFVLWKLECTHISFELPEPWIFFLKVYRVFWVTKLNKKGIYSSKHLSSWYFDDSLSKILNNIVGIVSKGCFSWYLNTYSRVLTASL